MLLTVFKLTWVFQNKILWEHDSDLPHVHAWHVDECSLLPHNCFTRLVSLVKQLLQTHILRFLRDFILVNIFKNILCISSVTSRHTSWHVFIICGNHSEVNVFWTSFKWLDFVTYKRQPTPTVHGLCESPILLWSDQNIQSVNITTQWSFNDIQVVHALFHHCNRRLYWQQSKLNNFLFLHWNICELNSYRTKNTITLSSYTFN